MRSIIAIFLILFLGGCGVKVTTLSDQHTDFKQYKTFCWMKGCEFVYSGPSYLMTPEAKAIFQKSIIEEMATKGIRYDSENPDLLIDLHVTMESEKVETYHREMMDSESNRFYRFYDRSQPIEIDLLKGTLVLDMADRKESKMVWRSVAVSYLDIHPELTDANIRKGIHKALEKFPPEQKK